MNKPLDFTGAKILVVGDFVLDRYLRGNVSRVSPEAPVPVVLVSDEYECLGGAGNVVENIVSLGGKVSVLGIVGNDDKGLWVKNRMRSIGVDTKYLIMGNNNRTIVKTRVSAQNQQLLRFDEEKKNGLTKELLDQLKSEADDIFSGISGVILSDYGKGMITKETAGLFISLARSRSIPVVVDPKGTDYSKYAGATACTPNTKEFIEATGCDVSSEDDILKCGVELSKRLGMDYVLVTRSEKGLSLIEKAGNLKNDYPAIVKEVIDVTGAGDTVIAMFTLALVSGCPLSRCCVLSNMAASIVVSKFGAATATVDEILGLEKTHYDQKIVSLHEIENWANSMHSTRKKIVFTNGCFDLVHAGHIASFRKARNFGDVLVVGLNSDASVRSIKGPKRPIIDEDNRAKLLESIQYIDRIVIFDDDTPESLIRSIRPDVLVKGKDWEGKKVAGGDFVIDNGGEVRFIDLEEGLSTTNIISKVLSAYSEKD